MGNPDNSDVINRNTISQKLSTEIQYLRYCYQNREFIEHAKRTEITSKNFSFPNVKYRCYPCFKKYTVSGVIFRGTMFLIAVQS